MRKSIFVAMSGLLVTGCFGGPDDGGDDPGNDNGANCTIESLAENRPAFPFNFQKFETDIYPTLTSCGAGTTCHQGPMGVAGYSVFVQGDDCDVANTYNEFIKPNSVNLQDPTQSRVYVAARGDKPNHPAAADAAHPDILLAFINEGKATYDAAGNEQDNGGGAKEFFDRTVFDQQVRPIMTTNGCDASNCHGVGAGGFSLTVDGAQDDTQFATDFEAAKGKVDLQLADVDQNLLYLKATIAHSGSTAVPAADASVLLDWITKAREEFVGDMDPNGGNGLQGCAPVGNFNQDVFNDEILPILLGNRDLNDIDENRPTTGCAREQCHGGPANGLQISVSRSLEENLQSFACYTRLDNPSLSQILLCPLNDARCQTNPHPGGDILENADDRNFQRILSYMYAASEIASPLDFGFFARTVSPIFDDLNAVENGAQNRTCADVTECHGVQIAGQEPPNSSNFGILPNRDDINGLTANFAAAANFTFFPDPEQSSLFLYPTNEIANKDNDLATGFAHRGGEDFAVDSIFAQNILKWAGGIRTDGQGFLTDVLISSEFQGVNEVTDAPLINERDLRPAIFEPSGGSPEFNQGQWELFSSPDTFIDLNEELPRDVPVNRIAYAVGYIINVGDSEVEAFITVNSPNATQLFAGENGVAQSAPGGQATAIVRVPAYQPGQDSTRVMVKVFQSVNEDQFGFDITFIDNRTQQPLDDDFVFKTVREGGI